MLFSLLLFACPEPVDFSDRSVDNSTNPATQAEAPEFQQGGAMQNPANNTAGGAAMAAGSVAIDGANVEGAPPSMGTFGADLPEAEIRPQFAQKDLADGSTIKGTATCDDCVGQLLVRALPPPPEDPAAAQEGLQLITQVILEKSGDFSIQVPKKTPVMLQVVDDANSDGIPSQGERMGMRLDGAVFADDVLENISLTVGVFTQKDPIEGLGVVPTPPLPGEEGEGVKEGEMIPKSVDAANGPKEGQPLPQDGQPQDMPPQDAPQPSEEAP